MPLPHQIDQPARRRDHQIDAGAQRLDLRTFAHPAENRGHAQRQMFGISAHVLFDLHDQLPRRRDDQRARPAALAVVPSTPPASSKSAKTKAAVFPVPVCAMPMTSCPGENVRNRRDLDRSRLGVAGVINSLQDFWGKIKGTK